MEQHTHEHTKAVLNRMSRAIGHMNAVKKMIVSGEWDVFSGVKLVISADGTITPLTDRVITVTYAEGEALNASVSFDGYDVFFYYYGDDITVEDALKILSNLK